MQLSLVPVESSFSHCFKDPHFPLVVTFAFSKKLLQQKMDLLLEGAHLTDSACLACEGVSIIMNGNTGGGIGSRSGRYKINLIKM